MSSRTSSRSRTKLAHALYTGQVSYPFIARRRWWYSISALLIVISLAGLLVRGLNLGIDFRGGVEFRAPVHVATSTTDEVRRAVLDSGVPDLGTVEVVSLGGDAVQVSTRPLDNTEVGTVRGAIASQVDAPRDQVTYSKVGSQWGSQITSKAVQALVVFLVLVMLQIWAYFRDWRMSVAAILALAHDLVITVGVYALVGFTVTPSTLIGVLTILGYSLYDTVVVFDKVRENVRDITSTDLTYSEGANRAVNQVLVRSVNTTIIGVLPVAAILFAGAFVLGSGPLQDLGLALFVGMIAGAYSSIFIATPVLTDMREREPAMREHTAQVLRRREKAARKQAADSGPAGNGSGEQDAATPEPQVRLTTIASPSRRELSQSPGGASRPQPRRTTRSQRKK